jgi:hypothetical protein
MWHCCWRSYRNWHSFHIKYLTILISGKTTVIHINVDPLSNYVFVVFITQMLTSIFLDEWNTYIRMSLSASPTIKFKVFGKEFSITLKSLITSEMNVYLSVGGKYLIIILTHSKCKGYFFIQYRMISLWILILPLHGNTFQYHRKS